jgi:hypothetical protein
MIRPIDSKEEDEEQESPRSRVGLKMGSPKIALVFSILLLGIVGGSVVMHQVTKKPFQVKVSDKVLNETKEKGSGLLDDLVNTGKDAGAAILGASIQFVQSTASDSANKVASAAASTFIKSTVPSVVDQINKLPPEQQKEVKQIICK